MQVYYTAGWGNGGRGGGSLKADTDPIGPGIAKLRQLERFDYQSERKPQCKPCRKNHA